MSERVGESVWSEKSRDDAMFRLYANPRNGFKVWNYDKYKRAFLP